MNVMVERVRRTQIIFDRFKDQPFEFGKFDCVRMAAAHLRGFGHRVQLSKGGSYRTLLGAHRALERAGFKTLAEALDRHGLLRIAPAAALVGDIVELESEDSMGALAIALSNGRLLGYHQDVPGAAVLAPHEQLAAWRVPLEPRR